MNFWERVVNLLDEKGINKKTLATEANFSMSNISKGIKDGNIPNVETALKISTFLNVSVEYLVTGKDSKKDNELLRKYKTTIQALEEIPAAPRKNIEQMILDLSKSINVII
ncbi:helix-turn-helix transcriptional regulator [uncultured Treponema sp.]|uniref:helix-turn-helix domain-containing protein n=1 Tax=Treponema sp. TaxID=166 RepID=UPI0025EAB140|nr:helix-turn-helix transcriptional regulator [uncultured Treponema sp.]MDY2844007.1 helix-turn-helix transcriptional regulator [Treponema sp.]